MELLYNGGRDIPTKYHMLTNKIPSERNGLSPFEILATGISATSKCYRLLLFLLVSSQHFVVEI